jgi:hypothetical protein
VVTDVFVLDEQYRVILASPGRPSGTLNQLFEPSSPADRLPSAVDSAIRSATSTWERSGGGSVDLEVAGLHLRLTPMQGPLGPHIAVFVIE